MTYAIITQGNKKLGKRVFHVNTASGESCPGLTSWCEKHCYTKKFKRFPTVVSKYAANLELWENDPGMFEATVRMDLAKLPDGSVFRWHVSGDIPDVRYADMIGRIANDFPSLRFFLYTRSYRVTELEAAIIDLETNYPNLKVWYSTDPSVPMQPDHRDARVFDDAAEAKTAGYVVCPEQSGRKASCSDCGLCFDITKPTFKLAFVTH